MNQIITVLAAAATLALCGCQATQASGVGNSKPVESTSMTTNVPQDVLAACKKAFTGFDKNDKSDLIAVLDDNVVFEFSDSLPYGGTYKGKKEFQAFWAHVYKEYEYFNYDAREVLQAGDYVIVPVVARAKTKAGFSMENEHLFLFRVKNGKIVYGRIYADTARGRDVLEGRQPRKYPKIILDGV